jgi:hypothetical protein
MSRQRQQPRWSFGGFAAQAQYQREHRCGKRVLTSPAQIFQCRLDPHQGDQAGELRAGSWTRRRGSALGPPARPVLGAITLQQTRLLIYYRSRACYDRL